MLRRYGVHGMREYDEVQRMLNEATRLRDEWGEFSKTPSISKGEFVNAIRNYNALRGVVKALQWMVKNPNVRDPLS